MNIQNNKVSCHKELQKRRNVFVKISLHKDYFITEDCNDLQIILIDNFLIDK